MKITEMQDRLEDLQNELLIISETTTAIETSLNEGNLDSSQIKWAFLGVVRNIDESAKEAGNLVKEFAEMRSVIESL